MPVLLLARGDPSARDLLRSAIQARYGLRPPTLETVRLYFKGRGLTKIGPVSSWLPIRAAVTVQVPSAIAWSYTVRTAGLSIRRSALAYDGSMIYDASGASADATIIQSVRQRLWALCAVLLMPLGEQHVELRMAGERALEAVHTQTGDSVRLLVEPTNKLSVVMIETTNPDSRQPAVFKLSLSDEHRPIDDLILPVKITLSWNDTPRAQLEPIQAEMNPPLPPNTFGPHH